METNQDKIPHKYEPAVKCDQLTMPIENLILTLRGMPVMLDRDLAELYGVETKRLNEQVQKNLESFPDSLNFHLLMSRKRNWSQIATGSKHN